jgi:hypothetical protein
MYFEKPTLLKDVPFTYSDGTEAPTPMIRPRLNVSDVILIKNALQVLQPDLIPELRERADLIIQEILRAEKAVYETEENKP